MSAAPVASRPLPTPRLPGFGVSLGITSVVVGALVVLPLIALVVVVARAEPSHVMEVLGSERTLMAYGLSFGASALAAILSAPLGLGIAWTLVRYEVPGRRFFDALVDLPFAMPTAVSGIALTQLWGPSGVFGAALQPLGLEVAFTRAGVVLALIFVSLPFVVRTVQPVIESFPRETEEAAASLGADRVTTFRRVIFPALRPALLAGATLGFARAIGEYGSVVFIAGNVPFRTEIAPLLVLVRLEEYDYAGAAAISTGMLVASGAILVILSQRAKGLRHG
ncbi:MAG: sulfate ABC transporter permease subunit CysT [Deltaproteobacteria bacterium]|nr:sulfate ABC transporter permease subunit CysT [Deltaproteobacteria bacterium]